MNHRLLAYSISALTAGLLVGVLPPARADEKLENFAQPALRDASATIDVVSKNEAELKKIGKGYVDAYKLSQQAVYFKEPGKVRFEGRKGVFTIRYVTNGSRKLREVPTLFIRKAENISKEPGKGDAIIDVGVITPAWVSTVESRWLGPEVRDGKTLQVFRYWHPADRAAKHTIWIDPATKTVREHVAHTRNRKAGKIKKRYVFSEPKQVNGVWVPTKVELYNGENKLAGVMRYESIKVNSNLPEKLFTF